MSIAPRIAVVGSINTDIIIDVAALPRPHETIMTRGLRRGIGGKGLNQAIAARRMGARVCMIGAVGNDAEGAAACGHLVAAGINTLYIDGVAAPTGTAHIMVAADGGNVIAVTAGANALVTPALVEAAEASIADAGLLMVQLETPLDAIEAALRVARRHNVRTLLNPAPAECAALSLLPLVDLVTPNETELATLTGTDDVAAGLKALVAAGAGAALVTLGGDGSAALIGDELVRQPAFPASAVDTTGAGDAYNGALAYALALGEPLPAAMRLAAAAGALAVSRATADAAPTYREALALLG
ncbi:ribokinase [Sphingomonas sp. BK069]|uniref:ribokinase n=1 Tax=Sphingomonas sp. BK069 TaxID=2586979 RepID=UPI00160E4C8A|nr:ribokinase [Sphingomonas sp. BK069]MBB3349907.1 ribokinase [Sphingomonas sp. BK069]